MNRRVVFCYNQVSLCIAVELANYDLPITHTLIFYSPSRCDPILYSSEPIQLVEYSALNFLKYLIRSFLKRPDEVCVPHLKGSKIINWYSRYARKLSAIDDGLDTFRETPKNISLNYFKANSTYYTFTYNFPLASWLANFDIRKVCSISDLAKSSKVALDVSSYDTIIVESPGVSNFDLSGIIDESRVVLVRHSNQLKNTFNNSGMHNVQGGKYSLEKTLLNFNGKVISGESMVTVFCVLIDSPKFSVTVLLDKKASSNLFSLINLIKEKSHIEISWY